MSMRRTGKASCEKRERFLVKNKWQKWEVLQLCLYVSFELGSQCALKFKVIKQKCFGYNKLYWLNRINSSWFLFHDILILDNFVRCT